MVLVGANRIAQRVGKNSQLVHGAQKKPTGWWAVGWMAVPFGCWVWGSCQFVPGMGVQVVGAAGVSA